MLGWGLLAFTLASGLRAAALWGQPPWGSRTAYLSAAGVPGAHLPRTAGAGKRGSQIPFELWKNKNETIIFPRNLYSFFRLKRIETNTGKQANKS